MSKQANTTSSLITKLINQTVMQHLRTLLHEMSTLNIPKGNTASLLSKAYSMLQHEYNQITNILGDGISKDNINIVLPSLINSLIRISTEATTSINKYLQIEGNKLDPILFPIASKVACSIPIAASGLQAINMIYVLYNIYKLIEENKHGQSSSSPTNDKKNTNTQFSVYSMILEGLLEVTYKLAAMNSHSNNATANKKQLRVNDLKHVFTDIKSNLTTIYSLLSVNNITNIINSKEDIKKLSTTFLSLKKDIDILSSGYTLLSKACKSLKASTTERNSLLQIIRIMLQITEFTVVNSITIQKHVNAIATNNKIAHNNSQADNMPEKVATQNNDGLDYSSTISTTTQNQAKIASHKHNNIIGDNANITPAPANNTTTDTNDHLELNSAPVTITQNISYKNMQEDFVKITQKPISLNSKEVNNANTFISKLLDLLLSTSKNNKMPFKEQVENREKTNNLIEL